MRYSYSIKIASKTLPLTAFVSWLADFCFVSFFQCPKRAGSWGRLQVQHSGAPDDSRKLDQVDQEQQNP